MSPQLVGTRSARPARREQAGLGGRRQRQAGHPRAEAVQPQAQPGSLEAGVADDEDAPAGPELSAGVRPSPPCMADRLRGIESMRRGILAMRILTGF